MAEKAKKIVMFSGGKDSTAMLLNLVEKEIPFDDIIMADLGMEFPEMYKHVLLEIIYKEYPEYWEKLKMWESSTYRTFRYNQSILDLENKFNEYGQGKLF